MVSDDDNALKAAEGYMCGEIRAGTEEAEGAEEAFIVENKLSKVEIIDVSFDQSVRGFDISGHHIDVAVTILDCSNVYTIGARYVKG
jgi:hypothetical protein